MNTTSPMSMPTKEFHSWLVEPTNRPWGSPLYASPTTAFTSSRDEHVERSPTSAHRIVVQLRSRLR
ncbi:hypothetical protein, partial [Micrococcus sp. GbtcB5]|uniref:hypothetical protein n=1 Tax=Micrococcus sp. GbtcB5 TaxID=2824750 RepID=UPI001C308592